ncbi:MAG: hypothetical protein ACKO34_08465 [Vampirovibrionales bacterium]
MPNSSVISTNVVPLPSSVAYGLQQASMQKALYALHQEFGETLTACLLKRYPRLLPRLAHTLETRITWKPYHRCGLYLVETSEHHS